MIIFVALVAVVALVTFVANIADQCFRNTIKQTILDMLALNGSSRHILHNNMRHFYRVLYLGHMSKTRQ